MVVVPGIQRTVRAGNGEGSADCGVGDVECFFFVKNSRFEVGALAGTRCGGRCGLVFDFAWAHNFNGTRR